MGPAAGLGDSSDDGEMQHGIMYSEDVIRANALWDNSSGLVELKDRLRQLPAEERKKISPPLVENFVPWTRMDSVEQTPSKLSMEQLSYANSSTMSLFRAMVGLPDTAKQRILDVIAHSEFDPKVVPRTVKILNKVADHLLVKPKQHDITLPSKPHKSGQHRADHKVKYYQIDELIAYIIKHRGTEGWVFQTDENANVIKGIWNSSGAAKYERRWTVQINQEGAKPILLLFYWDDYKKGTKRTNKINAFYVRVLNCVTEQLIEPICFAPSTIDVNVLLENIFTPFLRCLGKGITVNEQRWIGGLHITSTDHMAKVPLVLLKNPGATYSDVYSHRQLEELHWIADGNYKKRDGELGKLIHDRLQFLIKIQPQNPEITREITRIRELVGMRPSGFPALSQLEIFDEDIYVRQGIDYMHTETRGSLYQHGVALFQDNEELIKLVNAAVRLVPRYPHRPYFGNNDVITKKRQPWTEEEGLHLNLATSEQIDHFLCLLPILLHPYVDKHPGVPSRRLSAYEAHLEYTFFLTAAEIKRSDLPKIESLIHKAKVGMSELLPAEKLNRVKFTSMEYWPEQIKFNGPPIEYDTTIMENRHDGTKGIGTDLTNRKDVERQILSELATRTALQVPLRKVGGHEIRLFVMEKQPQNFAVGWCPCGKITEIHEQSQWWHKARTNGYKVATGQFLSVTRSFRDGGRQERFSCCFKGIVKFVVQNMPTYELVYRRLLPEQENLESRIKIFKEGDQEQVPAGEIEVHELLDVHKMGDKLAHNEYVRYPYRYR